MTDLAKYLNSLENVPCNLCGSEDTFFVHDKERFELNIDTVACKNCGLLYLNPRPDKESYRMMYEADYRIAVAQGTDVWLETEYKSEFGVCTRWILPFFLSNHMGTVTRMLDIGSSYGGLLGCFMQFSPEIRLHGVEPVVKVAEGAQQKTGADMRIGLYEPGSFDERFDLITITKALNHMLDPLGMINRCR